MNDAVLPVCESPTTMLGRITSAEIVLDMVRITAKVGGGADPQRLYLMLVVDDVPIAKASVPQPGGGTLQDVMLEIPDTAQGKLARLVLVDESVTAHLVVDDVWAWRQ